MPRYFMHIHDAGEIIADHEGQIFPDVEQARSETEAAVREMLAEKVLQGVEIDGQRIEILDERGRLVAVVPFRSQLRLVDEEG